MSAHGNPSILQFLCEQLQEGVIVTDRTGRVEWINGGLTRICGHSLDELRGRKPGEVLQGPETDRKTVQRISRAIADGQPCSAKILNYHKDGHSYWIDLRITPVRDENGTICQFLAIEREIPPPVPHFEIGAERLTTICASCKKFQDESGNWSTVERFLRDRFDLHLSHGCCPDCLRHWN